MHDELRIHLLNGVGVEYLKSSWFKKNSSEFTISQILFATTNPFDMAGGKREEDV